MYVCMCVCMYIYVCLSMVLTTMHLIEFTLGVCIVRDPRKCSVECEVVRMSDYSKKL